MSRKPLPLTYAATALLALALFSAPAQADLVAGNAAYQAGDYTTALSELVPVAERGNVEAQAIVGRIYLDGKGVAKDRTLATKYLTAAARAGNPQAQCDLGEMYREGLGLPKDEAKALYWYRLAAEQGDNQAQYHAGLLLLDGRGGRKDVPQGLKLLTRAAENGNMTAALRLGDIYAEGAAAPAVPMAPHLASIWYEQASLEGNATAQQKLGVLYRDGVGVPQNALKAYSLFRQAAEIRRSMGPVLFRRSLPRRQRHRARLRYRPPVVHKVGATGQRDGNVRPRRHESRRQGLEAQLSGGDGLVFEVGCGGKFHGGL